MSRKTVKSLTAALTASLAVTGAVSISSGAALAADPGFCTQYARDAVREAEVLSTLSCFRGFDIRWHRDYGKHYGWCLNVTAGQAARERSYRRTRLYECGYRG